MLFLLLILTVPLLRSPHGTRWVLPVWRAVGAAATICLATSGGLGVAYLFPSVFSEAHVWSVELFAMGMAAAQRVVMMLLLVLPAVMCICYAFHRLIERRFLTSHQMAVESRVAS